MSSQRTTEDVARAEQEEVFFFNILDWFSRILEEEGQKEFRGRGRMQTICRLGRNKTQLAGCREWEAEGVS